MPDVHITMLEGRSLEQKRKLAERITQVMVEEAGAKPESTHIVFIEVPHTNFAVSGGWSRTEKRRRDRRDDRRRSLLLMNFHRLIDGNRRKVRWRNPCGNIGGSSDISRRGDEARWRSIDRIRVAVPAGARNVHRAIRLEGGHIRIRTVLRVIHSLCLRDGHQVALNARKTNGLRRHHARSGRGLFHEVHIHAHADGGDEQRADESKGSHTEIIRPWFSLEPRCPNRV